VNYDLVLSVLCVSFHLIAATKLFVKTIAMFVMCHRPSVRSQVCLLVLNIAVVTGRIFVTFVRDNLKKYILKHTKIWQIDRICRTVYSET